MHEGGEVKWKEFKRTHLKSFAENYGYGLPAECLIRKLFQVAGFGVFTVERDRKAKGGPAVRWRDFEKKAPDMQAVGKGKASWVEVKHNAAATLYEKRWIWETGINLDKYEHYCDICDESGMDCFLYFLIDGETVEGSPIPNPHSGLFVQKLSYLRELKESEKYNHTSDWSGGMIYWPVKAFKHTATLEEIEEFISEKGEK